MAEEKSQLRIGTILNYINMGLGAIVPLLYTPVMLRILGQEEYGLYKLSGTITGYLGLLALGIGGSIVRYLIKARTEGGHEEEERVFSLFIVLYRIIAAVLLVAGIVLTFNIDTWYGDSIAPAMMGKMRILVCIMVCQSALSFIMGPYSAMITSHERFIFTQSLGIFQTIFAPCLNLVALFMGYASIGLAVTTFISSLLGQLIYCYYVRRKLNIHVHYKNLPWGMTREIYVFSLWLFLAEVTSMLYNSTDNLQIGARPELGAKAVAIYSIGCILQSMIWSFAAGITSVLAPRINKMCFEGSSNEELTDFAIKVGRLQMLIITTITSGFIAFGKPFIRFYAGAGYEPAYWISLMMLMPVIPQLVQNVFLNVSMARFKHKFRSIVQLFVAVLNVIGTYYILPYYGILGAAFVTCIAGVFARFLLLNWYYGHRLGMNTHRFWKSLYKITFIPILFAVVAYPFQNLLEGHMLLMLVLMAVYGISLVLLLYFFVMNEYEKDLIMSAFKPLKKIIRK